MKSDFSSLFLFLLKSIKLTSSQHNGCGTDTQPQSITADGPHDCSWESELRIRFAAKQQEEKEGAALSPFFLQAIKCNKTI